MTGELEDLSEVEGAIIAASEDFTRTSEFQFLYEDSLDNEFNSVDEIIDLSRKLTSNYRNWREHLVSDWKKYNSIFDVLIDDFGTSTPDIITETGDFTELAESDSAEAVRALDSLITAFHDTRQELAEAGEVSDESLSLLFDLIDSGGVPLDSEYELETIRNLSEKIDLRVVIDE